MTWISVNGLDIGGQNGFGENSISITKTGKLFVESRFNTVGVFVATTDSNKISHGADHVKGLRFQIQEGGQMNRDEEIAREYLGYSPDAILKRGDCYTADDIRIVEKLVALIKSVRAEGEKKCARCGDFPEFAEIHIKNKELESKCAELEREKADLEKEIDKLNKLIWGGIGV